jgi:peptidoglycan hydrolase CwlO-like protein
MRLSTSTAYRALAAALVATLFSGSVAFAAPADTTSTPAPAPAPAPVKPKPAPSVIPVPVDPATEAFRAELQRRQAQLDAFKAQLDQLDRELGIAAEEYNAANERLTALRERLDMTHQDLGSADSALTEQEALLATRIEAMYRDGEMSSAEILLGSKSIPDFLERLDFITTISSADADLAKQLRSQRDQIAVQERQLQDAEIEARALEFALKARKVEIGLRIADRQAVYNANQADMIALLDSEAARRSGEELALFRDIIAGASAAGVSIDSFGPAETVLSYHGIPYVWAGADPTGFDCSGLTMYVLRQHGVNLPHHAASQFLLGTAVPAAQLRSGDLVFFGSPVYHVGMYIGGGYFVHAPRTGDFIKVSRLADRNDFVGARRYPWRYRTGRPMGVAGVSLPANMPNSR